MASEPTDGQNACCVSLEKAGWTYDGCRSSEMEDLLKKKPIYVYEKATATIYRTCKSVTLKRVVVGKMWVTVYIVGHKPGLVMHSYKVDDYLRLKEPVEHG